MPAPSHLLAIDQGTTSTKVFVYDRRLKLKGSAGREFTQHFPRPALVEHDLEEIWTSTVSSIRRALRSAGIKASQIAGIGITNQRETTGLWMRDSGEPLHRALVWQDRRTADACAALRAAGEEDAVRRTTGLLLDPYFSATKMTWLLEHVKGARARAEAGDAIFGTIDTWLVYKLTGGRVHATDVTNASRTLLMDLETLDWDVGCLTRHEISRASLPDILPSNSVFGTTQGVSGLPDGIPICGIAGDQQSALFGQACFDVGESKCTYGTGAFLLMNTGHTPVRSRSGLLSTVAWQLDGAAPTYALEGSAFIAGAAVQWLRDGLRMIKRSSDIEALARTVRDTGDVVFVPALSGLGAPHWNPDARGLFAGMDRSTTAGHLARAVLEGIALQLHDLADAMRADSGQGIPSFRVDGGAAANDLLMQFQADILQVPVVRPDDLQTTALGAAALAGLGSGLFPDTESVRRIRRGGKTFKPKMKPEVRTRALEKWARAVRCA
ncbi:MAG TPA: glycerol kinase GlpK [Myxococcaceae bacterium]|nr:glycerol kinase GlpK [Myxococcaceae bacterium]